jgi:thiosulfate/3-mercaptopyruvate sulfurtransferase
MDAIDPSRVCVEPASEIERPLIEGLIQFYIYDFSEMPPADPDGFAFNERGGYDPFIDMADYWSREGHHPLVIRVDGRAAGFALINTLSHRGGTVERNMAEFFVARLYRRRGVASEAARQILALRPGLWEVAVMERNQAAQVFWPRAIASAAGVSGLRRLAGDGEHWRGPIWTFTVSADNAEKEATMTGWDGRGLVSTAWLADHLGDADLRVFDATVHLRPSPSGGPYQIESGRADYEAAHIPGAAFLDLPGELSDTASPFPFMMPPLDQLASALGSAGIGPDSRVVIYAATSPMWATRIWWMLHAGGFENAAVLDGGLATWLREGRAVEAGEQRYPPARLSLAPRAGAWADKQAVLAAIDDGGVCTINALSPSAHGGEGPVNYGRKGHIAGSRNVPYASLLGEDGTWRPDDELRAQFDAVGALGKQRAICYCGGGISATMAALALTRLGHPAVAVYDGSLSEWSRDPDAPMETGA